MSTSQAFHRGTAAIFSILTADQTKRLAELEGDPQLAERVAELAAKANEGDLSADDREEYEAYIEANKLLAVLQAEARYRLAQKGHSDGCPDAGGCACEGRGSLRVLPAPAISLPLIPLQIVGRTTVRVLQLNTPARLRVRRATRTD